MSAEATVAFYGVRLEIPDVDVALLDNRSHPLLRAARQFGLKSYWGDFGVDDTRHILFIGDELCVLGAENSQQFCIAFSDLYRRVEDTNERLKQANISLTPMLYFEWEYDQ